jgi:hypothetical protein
MVELCHPREFAVKTISAVIAVCASLLLALWWGVAPPSYAPMASTTVDQQRQLQCPSNSRLQGKACVCAADTYWNAGACVPEAAPTPR